MKIKANDFEITTKLLQEEDFKNFSGCIVLEDCLSSKGTWMKDPELLELFHNSRHYHITLITAMQFPLGIPPDIRCNFDYIFLLAEDFYSNQKRLYDHYAGMFPSFALFREVFLQLTENYGSMVIVNRGVSHTLLDKIFQFKAKAIKSNVFQYV